MTDQFDALGARRGSSAVITSARMSTTQEMSTRMRRYAITMAFRTACFIGMIFVHGGLRWVLFGAAVLLPYVAVLFANQAHRRHSEEFEHGEPTQHLQITTGDEPEVISGRVVDDTDEQTANDDRRVA